MKCGSKYFLRSFDKDGHSSVAQVTNPIFPYFIRQRPTSIGSLWLEVLNLTSKNISLSSNTWAFPYWPGYHPETPILARDGVEVQYG